MKKPVNFLFFLTFSLLFSCKSEAQKANPEAPKEEYNVVKVQPEKLRSVLAIPFSIAIADIEKQINTGVEDVIYEDNSYTDNDNDMLKMKVWKNGKITFTAYKNDVFDYVVPLKIWAEKGMSVFGMSQYKSTTFEMNLKFSSRFSITPDWAMQTQTTPRGFEWVTTPKITIGSVDIPITAIVGKIINSNHTMIARTIDETVSSQMSLKSYVVDAWNVAQKPFLVSEEYKTWVKITPHEILMTPLRTEGKFVKAKVGFVATTETLTGTAPAIPTAVRTVPALKYAADVPNDFQVNLINTIPYSEATAIAQQNFKNQKYDFKNGKYSITITDMQVYGSNDKLVVQIETKGDLKGNIYVKGIPVYNAEKQEIVLSNTELDIKTKNVLVRAASWLLEGTLERKIQNDFGMPLKDLLDFGKQSVEEALNTEYIKGVKLHGKITSLLPDKIIVSEQGISAIVKADGNLILDIEGLD